MNDKTIMPTPASHESVRLTLEQFCAIYRLPITIGTTASNMWHASLRDVDVLSGGISCGAVGFGHTEDQAFTALVKLISGKTLRIRTREETVTHYLKYGN